MGVFNKVCAIEADRPPYQYVSIYRHKDNKHL